ncbi:MAG: response regulator [Myxococcales bacterium]|nr:response regulator [Myxococcales bacterium]
MAASEERYRLLVESAPSLVVVLHEEQIAFINRTGARLLGDDNPTRFIGRAFADYIQETQRGRIVNVLKTLKNNATSLDSLQVRLTRLNGEEIVVELSMIPTDYQGRPAIHMVGHDITGKLQAEEEKERLQEQLQQAQKLESIGRLAGGVAHDFNNILTGILGYADLLTDPDFDPKTMRETAGEIRRAAERASNITQQLLAFSRRQMIKPQSVNLNTIIGDSTKMLKRLIGEHIDLMIQPVTEECFVHLDVGQMEQVLVNLVVNARDAMPDGGMVMIRIDPVVLTESDCEDSQDRLPGSYARISITDTGVGMAEEELKHIFEPFFTTKEVGKGTGLGLSTVYGIIQQNNGFIEVESRLGIGTTFRIYLPRVSAVEPMPVKQEVEVLPGGSETILVAEDEPMVRQLACRILERQGYRVLEAEDGKVALEVLEKYDGRLDLVLTDVIMPQMNGKQLIEKLSTLRKGFKILYMSGYTEDILGHHGVLDEKTHFIAKPFTIETLTYKVREVLDQG